MCDSDKTYASTVGLARSYTRTVFPAPSQHDSFILLSTVLLDTTYLILDRPPPPHTRAQSIDRRLFRPRRNKEESLDKEKERKERIEVDPSF